MLLHHLDVAHVLAGQFRHRDIKHVEVVLADQVQQQIQRPLEGFQHQFQRIRRDVQILREFQHRLAMDTGQRCGGVNICLGHIGSVGTATTLQLNRRARHGTKRTEHAAIA